MLIYTFIYGCISRSYGLMTISHRNGMYMNNYWVRLAKGAAGKGAKEAAAAKVDGKRKIQSVRHVSVPRTTTAATLWMMMFAQSAREMQWNV